MGPYTYISDDPEAGEAYIIPIVQRCPKVRAAFEALRHGLPLPDSSDSESGSQHAQPLLSRASSSNKTFKLRNEQPQALVQETVKPPTDEECGIPSALSAALSAIPTNLLPLSQILTSAQTAAVINGHTRAEVSGALAHAANLRRATGRARAILVIAPTEIAVREWVAGMCQVLDEVQVISYSRARTKRDATLTRLRQAQYPGIVIGSEKALRDEVSELWNALRENRLAKRWEIVVSEAVNDKSLEGQCSPLWMVREGIAEKGVIIAKKGLTKKNICAFARGLRGVGPEKRFWLTKEYIRKNAIEEGARQTHGDRSPKGGNSVEKEKVVPHKGRKARPSADGKENRLSEGERILDPTTVSPSARNTSKQSVNANRTRRPPRSSEKLRKWKELETILKRDSVAEALASQPETRRKSNDGVESQRKKEPSPPAKIVEEASNSGSRRRSICNETTRARKEVPKHQTKAAKDSKANGMVLKQSSPTSDTVQKALKRTISLPVPKTSGNRRRSSEPSVGASVRRRSPRLRPTPSSNEGSAASGAGKPQSPRTSSPSRMAQIRVSADGPTLRKKMTGSRSFGSSSWSGVNNYKHAMTNGVVSSDEDDKKSSDKIREQIKSKARSMRLYSPESSSSGEEKFYSPLSNFPTPQSEDTTPDKYFSPRTSFSPHPKPRLSGELEQNGNTSIPKQFIPKRMSASPRLNSQTVKKTTPKARTRTSCPGKLFSAQSSFSSVRAGTRNRRLDLIESPSDNQPVRRSLMDSRQVTDHRSSEKPRTSSAARKKIISHGSSHQKTGRTTPQDDRRRSVFDGLLSSNFPSSSTDVHVRRTKSFPASVQVKRETSPPPRGSSWGWGNPKYKASSATCQRKSLPTSSPGASILPVKRAFLAPLSMGRKTLSRALSLRLGSKPDSSQQASASRSGRSDNPRPDSRSRRSQYAGIRPASPVHVPRTEPELSEPEVIVISSESEDEVTPRSQTVVKKRRILDEPQRDLRTELRERKRNAKTARDKTPTLNTSRQRDRFADDARLQRRTVYPNNIGVPEEDLASFMRGVHRTRQVNDLTNQQMARYNKHLGEGKRFDNQGRRKEALDCYQKCFGIYDGDEELITRFLALSSLEGAMCADDIPRRIAKSPITRRSRRRRSSGRNSGRNSGRRARPNTYRPRAEIIDLT